MILVEAAVDNGEHPRIRVRFWSRRALPDPSPPPHPLAAPEVQVARALVEACLAHPDDPAAAYGVARTTWDLIAERLAGRLSAAERHGLPPDVLALFGQPTTAVHSLLGYYEERRRGGRVWYAGIAGLEPREAEVMGLAMEGHQAWEIRDLMQPKRGSVTAERPDGEKVALESVYQWLSEGRRKLRETFRIPAQEGEE